MSLKNLAFVTLTLFFITQIQAQRNYQEYNRLGINGGFSLFDINTADLVTEQGSGLMAGFTTRGSFFNRFDLIYGLSFYSSNIGISGRGVSPYGGGVKQEFIEYSIQAVQLNFLGSFNVVRHHLSIEFGPILNISGRMKLDKDAYKNHIIEGYNTLKADDIEDVSKVNARLMGGITAGLENFRLMAQYQFGLTNMLKNLNDLNLENSEFEGKSSTLVFGAVVYF